MTVEINLKSLADPLPADDIEWRIGQCGKAGDRLWASVLCYVTNRAIMQRLDDMVGPANWRNEYREWHAGDKAGVLCGISIRVDGEWVTKWDGAENTAIEAVKGGLSDSMKRAAVQWGIGRYLYKLDEVFPEVSTERKSKKDGWNYAKSKDAGVFYWKTPTLPAWALPSGKPASTPTANGTANGKPAAGTNGTADVPTNRLPDTGKIADDIIAKLNACATIEDLQKTWKSIHADWNKIANDEDAKGRVAAAKDSRKEALSEIPF